MSNLQDPTHSAEVQAAIVESFKSKSFLGKCQFILGVLATVFSMVIPDQLTYALGLRSNKRNGRFKLKRVITNPPIWVGEYHMPVATSNCIIVKGKDNTLFIRSAPEPTEAIMETIKNECEGAEPSVLLVSLAHDTFAGKWKAIFPKAKIVGQKKDIPTLNVRSQVDIALEDLPKAMLDNFYIKQIISTAPDFTRYEDAILILDLPDNKRVALLGCGFNNNQGAWYNPLNLRYVLAGTFGLGLLRPYSLFFTKSHKRAQQLWEEVAKTPNLIGLIFLHGDALVGTNVPQIMGHVRLDTFHS
jgi:hypothetical protein